MPKSKKPKRAVKPLTDAEKQLLADCEGAILTYLEGTKTVVSWPDPVPSLDEREDDDDRDFEQSQVDLPITKAQSTELMRLLMAKNPGADFFTLWRQSHVEVDPWIFVPLFVADDKYVPMLTEIAREMTRRYPDVDPDKLREKFDAKIRAASAKAGLMP